MAVVTTRELDLIRALEQIATGTSGEGARTDVEVMRQIAKDALAKIGWGPNKASAPDVNAADKPKV